jgi:hypothetical protein
MYQSEVKKLSYKHKKKGKFVKVVSFSVGDMNRSPTVGDIKKD